MIFQIHMIATDVRPAGPAAALMRADMPTARADTPLGDLLTLMAKGDVDAVPVLSGPSLVGVVTRTDLISAFARHDPRGPGG